MPRRKYHWFYGYMTKMPDPHQAATRAQTVEEKLVDALTSVICQLERAQYELGWDLDELRDARDLVNTVSFTHDGKIMLITEPAK